MEIPAGFTLHFRKSRVTDPWEPIYSRDDGAAIDIGLHLAEAHCNSRGFVHGGVIAALADNAMGISFVQAARKAHPELAATITGALTVNLNLDYLAAAKLGQWLQFAPRVIRAGRSLGFVDALVTADGRPVARANATFQLTRAGADGAAA